MENRAAYFDPRVIQVLNLNGSTHFAIHEVYFYDNDKIESYTNQALSARANSLEELQLILKNFLASGEEKITCGDLKYEYDREIVEWWLEKTELPVIKLERRFE